MSCLPLFSFSPSLSAALRPHDGSTNVTSEEERRETPSMTPKSADVVDSLYDKLSQVSVSHRRVDSFEWVMTQSAPNTPPTSLASNYEAYSPPPARLAESAPLPVPDEIWSTSLQPRDGRQKRGYFDWWSSPTLASSKGYTKLSTIEVEERPSLESLSSSRKSVAGPSRPLGPDVWTPTPISPSTKGDQLRPSQELNALGIVFPCTPPSSPPASKTTRALQLNYSPQEAAPRLPKRVSFSPIIDEVNSETCSDFGPTGQQSSSWGSYLPSSFLVARPPLTRTTSSLVPRRTVASRPILKQSTSTYQRPVHDTIPSTEMIPLSAKTDAEDTAIVVSPIPTQRLSTATSRADGHREVGDDSGDTDSVFVAVLQAAHKPARRRRDSLVSNTSCTVGDDCKPR